MIWLCCFRNENKFFNTLISEYSSQCISKVVLLNLFKLYNNSNFKQNPNMIFRMIRTDISLLIFVVTEVHGRTFGTWTLLTCTLCYICAFNLENKPLYLATFLSFIYALGHFLTEYLIYHTMEIKNLTTVGIFAGMKF